MKPEGTGDSFTKTLPVRFDAFTLPQRTFSRDVLPGGQERKERRGRRRQHGFLFAREGGWCKSRSRIPRTIHLILEQGSPCRRRPSPWTLAAHTHPGPSFGSTSPSGQVRVPARGRRWPSSKNEKRSGGCAARGRRTVQLLSEVRVRPKLTSARGPHKSGASARREGASDSIEDRLSAFGATAKRNGVGQVGYTDRAADARVTRNRRARHGQQLLSVVRHSVWVTG